MVFVQLERYDSLWTRPREGRASTQLFVSFAPGKRRSAVARSSLSRWIVEAIQLTCTSVGATVPGGLRAHSTRAVSTPWAVTRVVPIREVCMDGDWLSPSTLSPSTTWTSPRPLWRTQRLFGSTAGLGAGHQLSGALLPHFSPSSVTAANRPLSEGSGAMRSGLGWVSL